MPFLVWKTIGEKKRLVMRWNRRINGKPKVIKEIYIGSMENLARLIENPLDVVDAYSLAFGMTASILMMEKRIGVKAIVDEVMGHRDNDLSPGDYVLIFIMNRLSDPRSKNLIHEWMVNDYASTIFHSVTAQGFWNMMDRFSESHMRAIRKRIRDRLVYLGYDDSRLFVDGSNFYTFMQENDMAKRGHNKKHRYDLNQISYYIAASYDYIPFDGDSYAGNIPDVKTFDMILDNTPENAILIFDRGYNSSDSVNLLGNRRYIGALTLSDHMDLVDMPVHMDSSMETERKVYGKNHRIIVYRSSKLQERRVRSFMKTFRKVYMKVKRIMETGDSDAMDKARLYLESQNLNETIMIPDLSIDHVRMSRRLKMLGMNALFTSISDLSAEEIIELYRKRNRVEHCFRTINNMDIAFPIHHWTPQKIRVHMFMSLLAYLFLALIYNEVHKTQESVSLQSTIEIMKDIMVVYAARGKKVNERLDFKSEMGREMGRTMKLDQLLKG